MIPVYSLPPPRLASEVLEYLECRTRPRPVTPVLRESFFSALEMGLRDGTLGGPAQQLGPTALQILDLLRAGELGKPG
jgi:hypothetical protein